MAQQMPAQLRLLARAVLRQAAPWQQQHSGSFAALSGRALTTFASDATDSAASSTQARSWVAFGAAAVVATAGAALPARGEAPANKVDPYQRPATLSGPPAEVTLYQYEVCPFCCKVKALLDYHKIPYHVIEVNPLTKSELKWSDYKKVPIVRLQPSGDVVNDSSAIMSRLAAEIEAAAPTSKGSAGAGKGSSSPRPARRPAPGSAEEAEELKWRKWVDERLVKVITANIYRNWDETFATFRYITEQTNWHWGTREAARLSGALIMWQVGKGMPKKYKIEGDLREALYKECDSFVEALGTKRPFMGGSVPNLADLAVYGVLTAVKRTPTFEDALAHSKIRPWYERMAAVIGEPARIEHAAAPKGV